MVYNSQFKELNYNLLNDHFLNCLNLFPLHEKTFNISKDVNFIYDKFFKKHVDDFENIYPVSSIYGKFNSSILKDTDSKEAHSKNPVDIICGILNYGSYYNPVYKEIGISLNLSSLNMYKKKDKLSAGVRRALENDFSESRIKATIAHELSHWISDSIYNSYLHKISSKALKIPQDSEENIKKVDNILALGKPSVLVTHYEIDAQIHGIKEIKNFYSDSEWNEMSLKDLFYEYSVLSRIVKSIYSVDEKIVKEWLKDVLKRMDRENLLGKNMKSLDIRELFSEKTAIIF